MILDEKKCPRPFIALLNNRADRPLRMLSFASLLGDESIYDYIMLIGAHKVAAKRTIQRGLKKDHVISLRSRNPRGLIDEIYTHFSASEFTIVGMGNSKGLGGKLSLFLTTLEKRKF